MSIFSSFLWCAFRWAFNSLRFRSMRSLFTIKVFFFVVISLFF
jgi:hypothetical protein